MITLRLPSAAYARPYAPSLEIPMHVKNYSLSPLIAGIDVTCEIMFLRYYPYLKSTKYPPCKYKLI